jgi:hypothetical protein
MDLTPAYPAQITVGFVRSISSADQKPAYPAQIAVGFVRSILCKDQKAAYPSQTTVGFVWSDSHNGRQHAHPAQITVGFVRRISRRHSGPRKSGTDCQWVRSARLNIVPARCLLPTAYCLLCTAYCLLPTVYCLLTAHDHSGRRDRHWLRRSESSSRGRPSSNAAPDRLVDPANACCYSKIVARKTASIL